MSEHEIISWLLQGDVSIQYQLHRDLLGSERKDFQERIEKRKDGGIDPSSMIHQSDVCVNGMVLNFFA
jgi:hypothetical protein